jgi:hypothetical protein
MLNKMKDIVEYIECFSKNKEEFKSKRLQQLCTIDKSGDENMEEEEKGDKDDFENINNQNGLFPDLVKELAVFEEMVAWK